MKRERYKAIVCLPKKSNDKDKIIAPAMYYWQGKEIILEPFDDPDYDYIDENCYFYDMKKDKLLVRKSTPKNLDKFTKMRIEQKQDLFAVIDGFMWAKEWLKNIEKI